MPLSFWRKKPILQSQLEKVAGSNIQELTTALQTTLPSLSDQQFSTIDQAKVLPDDLSKAASAMKKIAKKVASNKPKRLYIDQLTGNLVKLKKGRVRVIKTA